MSETLVPLTGPEIQAMLDRSPFISFMAFFSMQLAVASTLRRYLLPTVNGVLARIVTCARSAPGSETKVATARTLSFSPTKVSR